MSPGRSSERPTQQLLTDACAAFERASRVLRARPVAAPRSAPPYVDGAIEFELAGGKRFVIFATVNEASNLELFYAPHRLHMSSVHSAQPLLLVSRWIPPKTAGQLMEMRIPYLDTAGNAYLEWSDSTILIQGQPKPEGISKRPTSKAVTPQGLAVTYTLLTNPLAIEMPLRAIASLSGTALSTANQVVDDLLNRGLIAKRSGAKRIFLDRERAIQEWVSNYSARLRPKLGSKRFTAPARDWWKHFDFASHEAHLGGEAAAELLAGHLKARNVTLYCRDAKYNDLIRHARLRSSADGEVEILQAFWPPESDPTTSNEDASLVHPLLIFADLIATGDSRNLEAARGIHDQFLRGA